MARPLVEIEGGAELRRALREANADLRDLTAVNRKVATVVATTASRMAPRRTGRLAFSVKPRATRTTASVVVGGTILGGAVSVDGRWRGEVPYAAVIHWGWPRNSRTLRNVATQFRTWTPTQSGEWFIRPNPFITLAAKDTEPWWTDLYRRELERIVDEVGRKSDGRGA